MIEKEKIDFLRELWTDIATIFGRTLYSGLWDVGR